MRKWELVVRLVVGAALMIVSYSVMFGALVSAGSWYWLSPLGLVVAYAITPHKGEWERAR